MSNFSLASAQPSALQQSFPFNAVPGPSCGLLRDMRAAFGALGGVGTGDQVVQLVRGGYSQPVSRVARWIVDREIVSYPWQGEIMVPLFQFVDTPLRPMHVITHVLGELGAVMDDWEIANWLATGNDWLDGRTPAAALLNCDERAVLWSARADRYVMLG